MIFVSVFFRTFLLFRFRRRDVWMDTSVHNDCAMLTVSGCGEQRVKFLFNEATTTAASHLLCLCHGCCCCSWWWWWLLRSHWLSLPVYPVYPLYPFIIRSSTDTRRARSLCRCCRCTASLLAFDWTNSSSAPALPHLRSNSPRPLLLSNSSLFTPEHCPGSTRRLLPAVAECKQRE